MSEALAGVSIAGEGSGSVLREDGPRDVCHRIERELGGRYLERGGVIRGLLVAALSGSHVLMLGMPGTAKSELAEDLCRRIRGQYFSALLFPTSRPEEILGPHSIRALEKRDAYIRKTSGYLPEADVAFLDEVFRGNSAVLNGLLWLINERVMVQDGVKHRVPLRFMVAAANGLPDLEEENLGAFYDRILLRYEVGNLESRDSFTEMLASEAARISGEQEVSNTTVFAPGEFEQAVAGVRAVDLSSVMAPLGVLRERLLESAGIEASPRRWAKSLAAIQAHAYLEGRSAADQQDLRIMADILWDYPDQRREVGRVVLGVANPSVLKVREYLENAEEIRDNAFSASENDKSTEGRQAHHSLKKIIEKIEATAAEVREASPRSELPQEMQDAYRKVRDIKREVDRTILRFEDTKGGDEL